VLAIITVLCSVLIAVFCFYTVVPMFHCNGWFFTWTMANVAGCNFLVRQVRPDVVCNLIQK
jgi:acyl-CoA synthetase (AMP-forming)/AMP-acid ligase II